MGRRSGHLRIKFVPRNPEKYRGDRTNITARSSWERLVMVWLDRNPSVISWSSEEVVVPYISPVDGQPHRYFVDFAVKYRDKEGRVQEKLLEVKPHGQTIPPKNRNAKGYKDQVETYMVNLAKWEAADKYATAKGAVFQVLTEYNLGLVKQKVL